MPNLCKTLRRKILKQDGCGKLFRNVISIFDSIRFSKEIEFSNYRLLFPDYSVERKQNDYLKINIFRNPIYAGKYLDYKSVHVLST